MNGNENNTLIIVSETAPQAEGQNPPLLYRIDLQKVMQMMTLGDKNQGNDSADFEIGNAHNRFGAQLYYSPDTAGEHLSGMHIYCYLHENPNVPGTKKGNVFQKIEVEADAYGRVSYLGITNPNGRIEISPLDDHVFIEKYDPDDPPISMHEHGIQESIAGHSIPYSVVPNGSSELSTLKQDQYDRIRQILESGLDFLIPSVEITQERPQLLADGLGL